MITGMIALLLKHIDSYKTQVIRVIFLLITLIKL